MRMDCFQKRGGKVMSDQKWVFLIIYVGGALLGIGAFIFGFEILW